MRFYRAETFRAGVLVSLLVTLVGCATQLAPLYDKALLDGLVSANVDTLELMASAKDGVTKETFSAREAQYSRLIGRFEALAIQAAARPVPGNNVLDAAKKIMGSRTGLPSPGQVIPSSTAIQEISKTIIKMRDTDKKQGVTAFEVQAFKSQVLIYMDQALTYEAALER